MDTKQVGIEKLNFFVPPIYIDLVDLAKSRNVNPDKYTIGLGLEKMSLCPVSQDIITMGANAAFPIVSNEDKKLIYMVILATESGIDHSKSGAVAIHQLLDINPYARCIEMKHACFSETAGLLMAKDYVSLHPDRKVLVIGSDVSKYGFNNPGEETQGAGAVAMLISSHPKILVLDNNSVAYTEDVYDFWRPVYSEIALVDGKLSNEVYNKVFHKTIEEYSNRYDVSLEELEAICLHIPYYKLGKKVIHSLEDKLSKESFNRFSCHYEESSLYSKKTGNIYTGSLYLGLISLLNNSKSLKPKDKIGFFSYGSGAVGEFFVGELVEGYQDYLFVNESKAILNNRTKITVDQYEQLYSTVLPTDGSELEIEDNTDQSVFKLVRISNHQRFYDVGGD